MKRYITTLGSDLTKSDLSSPDTCGKSFEDSLSLNRSRLTRKRSSFSQAFDSLNSQDRQILTLTETFEYSLPETASLLNLSEEKIKKRLQRAKLNLLRAAQ